PVTGVEYTLGSGPDFFFNRAPKKGSDLRSPPDARDSPPIIWALRPLVSSIPVLEFRADVMTRPRRLSGADPDYPEAASKARSEGLLIFKCVIGTDGRVSNCRSIKSLHSMEKVVEVYA